MKTKNTQNSANEEDATSKGAQRRQREDTHTDNEKRRKHENQEEKEKEKEKSNELRDLLRTVNRRGTEQIEFDENESLDLLMDWRSKSAWK